VSAIPVAYDKDEGRRGFVNVEIVMRSRSKDNEIDKEVRKGK
jgi:hypothetical protein